VRRAPPDRGWSLDAAGRAARTRIRPAVWHAEDGDVGGDAVRIGLDRGAKEAGGRGVQSHAPKASSGQSDAAAAH
jgi:hypothetical protein